MCRLSGIELGQLFPDGLIGVAHADEELDIPQRVDFARFVQVPLKLKSDDAYDRPRQLDITVDCKKVVCSTWDNSWRILPPEGHPVDVRKHTGVRVWGTFSTDDIEKSCGRFKLPNIFDAKFDRKLSGNNVVQLKSKNRKPTKHFYGGDIFMPNAWGSTQRKVTLSKTCSTQKCDVIVHSHAKRFIKKLVAASRGKPCPR